ncbi:lysyl-tRNA synthetase [Plesiocystis pacifica SIR-1]|uniref:Lysyl-tRNA synthetase n=2 Tax=Plesiocystis pacifica TaxID=191768 RepID=A6FZT5_9BACT|nr:lysyl-tRNA synthetase [Plesiocystis pacifica SIR-1]
MGLPAALRLPEPDERVEGWHISPLVDLSAYALSWVWVLVPLLLLGPARADYLWVYLAVIAITDLHRHFGLPYVYLDSQVRERYPARFWLLPALFFVAFAASPTLVRSDLTLGAGGLCAIGAGVVLLVQIMRRDGGPDATPLRHLLPLLGAAYGVAGGLTFGVQGIDGGWWFYAAALGASTWIDWRRLSLAKTAPAETEAGKEQAIAVSGGRGFVASGIIVAILGVVLLAGSTLSEVSLDAVLAAVGSFAALWNFWHVYMQKFGILRMYNAKAGGAAPAWLDKALVLCWLPLYFAWLGPMYREIAVDYFDDASAVLPGFISLLEQAMPVTIPVTVGLVVVIHILWLHREREAHGLRSAPRLWMVGGTTALALCFFVFDPIKVYMAFAFSHALEYCVFVWAFQRKRYHRPLTHRPTLGALLRHPVVFYLGMVVAFAVAIALLKYWGRYIAPDADRPELLGYRTAVWLTYWGIYQSMIHFYFDGFLWKMRLPSVRANL